MNESQEHRDMISAMRMLTTALLVGIGAVAAIALWALWRLAA